MLTEIVTWAELEGRRVLDAEKNTAAGLQNIINVSKLINSENIQDKKDVEVMDLKLEYLEFYAEVVKGYLFLPPHHWVREKFPDSLGIVRAFESIRVYVLKKDLQQMFDILDSGSSSREDAQEIVEKCESLLKEYMNLPKPARASVGYNQKRIQNAVAKIKEHFAASRQCVP